MRILNSILLSAVISSLLYAQHDFPVISGWTKSDTVYRFNENNLWERINGAADYYLNYGFQRLEVIEYAKSEDEYITVEVYHHKSPLYAFGIYAFERPTEVDFLEVGDEGYLVHSSLNFHTNNKYIKINSHQDHTEIITTLKKIATELAASSVAAEDSPTMLSLFPEKNKVPHTGKFIPANFIGYSFLHSAMMADYQNNNESWSLFFLSNETPEASLSMLKKYFEFLKISDSPVENRIYPVEDPFNGFVSLTVKGNYVLGIINLKDQDRANEYLKEFEKYFVNQKGRGN